MIKARLEGELAAISEEGRGLESEFIANEQRASELASLAGDYQHSGLMLDKKLVSLSRDSTSMAHASTALRESLETRQKGLEACQAQAEARLEMERAYIEATAAALGERLGLDKDTVSAAGVRAAQLHEAQVQLKQLLATEQRLLERLGGRAASAKELYALEVTTEELERRAEAASRPRDVI